MTDYLADARDDIAARHLPPRERVALGVLVDIAESLRRLSTPPQGAAVVAPTITRHDDTEKSRPGEPDDDPGPCCRRFPAVGASESHVKCAPGEPAIVQLDRVEAEKEALRCAVSDAWARVTGPDEIGDYLYAHGVRLDRAEGR